MVERFPSGTIHGQVHQWEVGDGRKKNLSSFKISLYLSGLNFCLMVSRSEDLLDDDVSSEERISFYGEGDK